MFFFMRTEKKLQCYPLCFFSWWPIKNHSVTLYVFFMTTAKKRQCYPLCFFQDDRKKMSFPLCFFSWGPKKTTVLRLTHRVPRWRNGEREIQPYLRSGDLGSSPGYVYKIFVFFYTFTKQEVPRWWSCFLSVLGTWVCTLPWLVCGNKWRFYCFFPWRPIKNNSVTPHVSFDKNDSVTPYVLFDTFRQCYPLWIFHDDR